MQPSRQFDQSKRHVGHRGHGICLILGGGGARGFAHLGVLKRLEQEGIPVASIVGCSVGGLVAAFYAAAGSSPEAMVRMGEQITAGRLIRYAMMKWSRRASSATNTSPGKALELLEACSFHRLHHGVRYLGILAYDLVSRQSIVFTGRDAHREVTVSEATVGGAAIPFLFPPKRVKREGVSYRLVDSGFISSLPIEAALQPPFDVSCVVAVDLAVFRGIRHRRRAYWEGIRKKLGSRLLCLEPEVDRFGTIFFRREEVRSIFGAGWNCLTQEALMELRRRIS